MNADPFLERVARRLGRERRERPSPREALVLPQRAVIDGADLAARFTRELELVGGRVVRACDRTSLAGAVQQILDETGARSAVAFARAELPELDGIGFPVTFAGELDAVAFRAVCAAADVGFTNAVAAIAETGSLVIESGPGRPRMVSLLPRMHVAILRASRIVVILSEAWPLLGDPPSQRLVVTGPSRTSDIENDLTIGVHGPAAVCAILVEDA